MTGKDTEVKRKMDDLRRLFSEHPSSCKVKGDTAIGIVLEFSRFEERVQNQEWRMARISAKKIVEFSRTLEDISRSEDETQEEGLEEETKRLLNIFFPAIKRGL